MVPAEGDTWEDLADAPVVVGGSTFDTAADEADTAPPDPHAVDLDADTLPPDR